VDLKARLEQAAESKAYSSELRERARTQYALVQRRLDEGDFQVGDQVALAVEGEQQLTGAFPVAPGLVLKLPLVGDVPLAGVLRSELQEHLARHLEQFIRNPVVQARSLIRISIVGVIGKPGFYVVPSESLLTEALMAAGGPSVATDLARLEIERGGTTIWAGQPLQDAIAQGWTLDQLSIRAGDQLVLPPVKASGSVGGLPWRQVLTGVGAVAVVIRTFTRWF
jgi:protein involved in polysaccharide export with SLBB domain